MYRIHKFMKRESQKSITKRVLVGYLGLRDLGKFEKYQRKLDSVASGFEVQDLIAFDQLYLVANWQTNNQNEPNNVDIVGVLLETIKNRAQNSIENEDSDEDHDEDSDHSEETAIPVGKKKRAAVQEAFSERSRVRKGKAKVKFIEQMQAVLKELMQYSRLRLRTVPVMKA